MSLATAPTANKDQIDYWNTEPGQTWAELQDLLDRQIGGIGARAIAVLAPRPGERIIDVGCGCGQTSLELARRVGAGGAVLGVDISAPMLAVARRRAEASGASHLRLIEADAQAFTFEGGWADAAFSRFGVMFFADPTAAFANVRRALKSGGRLAFTCWREPALNPFMTLPFAAALPFLPEPPPPPEPTAPGPFAFADEDRLRRILTGAGFVDISLEPHSDDIGGGSVEEALRLTLRIGPLGRALRERPQLAQTVAEAVRAAIAPQMTPKGVFMGSASWLATARNP